MRKGGRVSEAKCATQAICIQAALRLIHSDLTSYCISSPFNVDLGVRVTHEVHVPFVVGRLARRNESPPLEHAGFVDSSLGIFMGPPPPRAPLTEKMLEGRFDYLQDLTGHALVGQL